MQDDILSHAIHVFGDDWVVDEFRFLIYFGRYLPANLDLGFQALGAKRSVRPDPFVYISLPDLGWIFTGRQAFIIRWLLGRGLISLRVCGFRVLTGLRRGLTLVLRLLWRCKSGNRADPQAYPQACCRNCSRQKTLHLNLQLPRT